MAVETREARIILLRDYVESMRARIDTLRPRAQESPALAFDAAYAEIETAHEELTVADEELRAQAEAIDAIRMRMRDELAHYRALFDDAPDGYLVTDGHGIIVEANHTIATALGVHGRFLERKPLINFVVRNDCSTFRSSLTGLATNGGSERMVLGFRPRDGGPHFIAEIRAVAARAHAGHSMRIRWSIRTAGPVTRESRPDAAGAKLEATLARLAVEAVAKGRRLIVEGASELRLDTRAAAALGAIAESLVMAKLDQVDPNSVGDRDLVVVLSASESAASIDVSGTRATLPLR